MKEQVNRLVTFFHAMTVIVDIACSAKATKFVEYLTHKTEGDRLTHIGGFTITDFMRQTILTLALMIRAYFGLFIDVASMYTDISTKFITPGVGKIEKLGFVITGEDEKTRQAELDA